MIVDNRGNNETNKSISVESDGIITNQIFHAYETHDYNFKLSKNLTFYAKTPFVHSDNSLWLTKPHLYIWGHRAQNQLIERVNQTCEAMPGQKVKCTNYMGIMDVSVKYIMQLSFTQLGMASLFEALWEGQMMKSVPIKVEVVAGAKEAKVEEETNEEKEGDGGN